MRQAGAMVRTRALAPLLAAAVLWPVVVGCSGGSEAAPRTTTTTRPGQTTTLPETVPESVDPSPDGLPAGPLRPSTPQWSGACTLADSLIAQAWQLQSGELTDPTVVGGTLLAMIDQIPAGAADEQVGFVGRLAAAFVSGEDLAAYRADFREQAEALLAQVAAGCGVAEGEPLPLPADTIGTIERFLFG